MSRPRALGLANVEATLTPPRRAAWLAEAVDSERRTLGSSAALTRACGGGRFILIRRLPAHPTRVKERPWIASPANIREMFQRTMMGE